MGCYGKVKIKKNVLKVDAKLSKKTCDKQRNKCVNLLRKIEKA